MAEINYLELDRVERHNQKWRKGYPDLSSTYVGGEGNDPIAILIGEAPGAQEELKRRPFVGPAGIVLRDLMEIAGLYSEAWKSDAVSPDYQPPTVRPDYTYGYAPNCWLTNVVKFRPPRNRTPALTEISSVRKLLRTEWKAVGRPEIIIPIGGVALQALYGQRLSILRVAGTLHCQISATVPRKRLYIWPMVHPSFGIRSGNVHIQKLLEQDWEKLGRWLHDSNHG